MSEMEKMNEKMKRMEELEATAKKSGKNPYVIMLKEPVTFEGKKYDCIDLTGLDDIRAADMIEINKRLAGRGNSETFNENSLEYALHMAAAASSLPIEFFEQLKGNVAIRVKACVLLFLYKQA